METRHVDLRPNSSRTTIAMAVVIVLAFIGAEWSFRVFEPFWDRLAAPRSAKMLQYNAALNSGRSVDHIFIGSSTTMMGVDPTIVDAITGRSSFNAGQLGYTAINLNLELAREIIDARFGREIVYILDSWVASLPNTDRRIIDQHGRSDHFLWLSSIFRNRSVFAFWIMQIGKGKLIRPADAWQEHLQASQRFTSYAGVTLRPNGYLETFAQMNAGWPDYNRPKEIDPATSAEIVKLIQMCAEAGVRLTIVRGPEFERTYEENRSTHLKISAHLAELAAREQVRLIDFYAEPIFSRASEQFFMDIHHVNADGAKIFSAAIGHRLRDAR